MDPDAPSPQANGARPSHEPAPTMPRGLLLAFLVAGALVLVPFWSWLVLAIWVGQFGRRMVPALTRFSGRRQRAAAILTAALIAVLLIPIGLLVYRLVGEGIALFHRLADSPEAREMFEKLVSKGEGAPRKAGAGGGTEPVEVIVKHSGQAWHLLTMLLGIAAKVVLGLFVFLSATYAVLADGPRGYRWLEDHLPVDRRVTRRFADAFSETGRGLFIGVGGAGLAQSIVATITYVALGVPDALVLGLLTLMASVIPSIGTGIVWAPVAIGLALVGRTEAAIAMGAIGVAVIGSIDNIVRPMLSRRGNLALPSILIMVSMFGGIALVGASGLILGPLALRLAKEALLIDREARAGRAGPALSEARAAAADGPGDQPAGG
jgi:predicted PurR-regulated permease PerM